MFRQGLRRCARPASTLSSAAILCRPRAAAALARYSAAPSTQLATPLKAVASIARAYSTDTVAASQSDAPTDPETDGLVVKFQDLENHGVHPNLLRAITSDLGYESMTPVQAKTINPALRGTDM